MIVLLFKIILRHILLSMVNQDVCENAVEKGPRMLIYVPDRFKTWEMCEKAVEDDSSSLQYVPDWFVTHQKIKLWHDDHDYSDNDRLIEWYEGYKKRQTQKAKIKKELMPIAWHPSRYWDWCMSEEEKEETEKLWA